MVRPTNRSRNLLAVIVLPLVVSSAVAQPEGPRVVKMAVSPSPKPEMTIPYPLLPHARDIKQGNAAIFYQRSQSLEWWGPSFRKAVHQSIESLEKPWDAKANLWNDNWGPLKELDVAARCESCDWQLLDRVRAEGIVFVIPDIQSMRTLGAANAVRTRSLIHQGEWDKASRGLQTQFAMSRHVGEAPMVISYLVGAAVAGLGIDNLEEWVQEPDAPNLYWALTDLPQPLIDWRRPLQHNAAMSESLFPEIHRALRESPPEPIPARVLIDRLKKHAALVGEPFHPVAFALAAAQAEPAARARFRARGLADADIDRLPVLQLTLMDVTEQNERQIDELLSLQNLPYWQAAPFLKKMRLRHEQQVRQNPVLFRYVWLTAHSSVFSSRPRIERPLALLRHIEALRLYAGQYDGQWPDSLDELRDGTIPLPLPVDPYTGKAFSYRREGGTAILEAFAPPGVPGLPSGVRYELTVRSK